MDIDGLDERSDPPTPDTTGADAVLRIDCAECALEHSDACQDCVVTFLCDRTPGDAVLIDLAEERAMRMLADAGLAPGLRHRRRSV
ncbi:MAG: hypothetical protein AAGK32_18750 [Actinomycetota bacterium]